MTMMPTTCRRYDIQSARDQARMGAGLRRGDGDASRRENFDADPRRRLTAEIDTSSCPVKPTAFKGPR
jgi:hypothetical protein